jgi:hypothetical protein
MGGGFKVSPRPPGLPALLEDLTHNEFLETGGRNNKLGGVHESSGSSPPLRSWWGLPGPVIAAVLPLSPRAWPRPLRPLDLCLEFG